MNYKADIPLHITKVDGVTITGKGTLRSPLVALPPTSIGASSVTVIPSGGISSTNVEAALVELDSEKQVTLVSGSNIRTVNGNTLLGSTDLVISGGSGLTYPQVFSAVSLRV